ncbi:MAG: hypothetical protein ABI614_02590 [Planctomycetota bacterium]
MIQTLETYGDQEHLDRVAAFQRDIAAFDPVTVIRKYITTGVPVTIDASVYFELRSRVAAKFEIHPNDVVVVGSSRLGFSLKQEKRFRPNEPKDVDVAVVSEALFNAYWEMVFDEVRFNRDWATRSKKNRQFVNSLFAGWITPQKLPNLPSFDRGRDWSECFANLTRERVCGIRSINGRLYRDWKRLEAYQEIHLLECKHDLERG